MPWTNVDWIDGYKSLREAIYCLESILYDAGTDHGGKADIICLKFRLESALRRWEELGDEWADLQPEVY